MHFKQFHFFKRDLQKGPKCYEKMHGLGIIQKVQQYLKLVRIFWRNCLEFFSSQVNGAGHLSKSYKIAHGTYDRPTTSSCEVHRWKVAWMHRKKLRGIAALNDNVQGPAIEHDVPVQCGSYSVAVMALLMFCWAQRSTLTTSRTSNNSLNLPYWSAVIRIR